MFRQWGRWQEERGCCCMFFTSLLSTTWLLLLGWAVTRANSQPDDSVISPNPIADALLEPPAYPRLINFSEFDVTLIGY